MRYFLLAKGSAVLVVEYVVINVLRNTCTVKFKVRLKDARFGRKRVKDARKLFSTNNTKAVDSVQADCVQASTKFVQ